MGQKSLKQDRRSLRRYAEKKKNSIVSSYMSSNWDKVVASSVVLIRQFNFTNRFKIATTILFKPIKQKKPKNQEAAPAAPPQQATGARV